MDAERLYKPKERVQLVQSTTYSRDQHRITYGTARRDVNGWLAGGLCSSSP